MTAFKCNAHAQVCRFLAIKFCWRTQGVQQLGRDDSTMQCISQGIQMTHHGSNSVRQQGFPKVSLVDAAIHKGIQEGSAHGDCCSPTTMMAQSFNAYRIASNKDVAVRTCLIQPSPPERPQWHAARCWHARQTFTLSKNSNCRAIVSAQECNAQEKHKEKHKDRSFTVLPGSIPIQLSHEVWRD